MKFQPEVFTENGLFYGDNLYIMQGLMKIGYKGKFDMIYFDGPFNSGWIFSIFNKELNENIIDPWNEIATIKNFYDSDAYRSNYRRRIEAAKELLNEKGILVFQTSQKEGHYMKVILDEIFGSRHFLGEVIWKFADGPLYEKSQFGLNHETLFFYAKSDNYLKKTGVSYSSVWDDIGKYGYLGEEDTFYATQKPEKLMERILQMTTDENALVGDFYCGSGTMPLIAEKMKRRWIASDHSRVAIQTAASRMEAAGTDVTMYQLVEDFNLSYLQGNEYKKKTQIPFSLNELQGIKEKFPNKSITIQAYEYTPEIDLIQDQKYTFQLIMPSVAPSGSKDVVKRMIPRPVPILTEDGYQLLIANPLDWILHHIVHGEITEAHYIMDIESLQRRVNDVYLRIKDNWIDSIKEYEGYDLLKDVFGHFYKVPKGRELSYGK
ncbi:DNA methyltransferase [Metabacillus fastidiosus]|uniref:Site-specific DNA-methyltransferase n=1 Tax=Metabacillus fastidiosus TaxID=1458 RepID=A0ABU6P213_9BACI|nr:site-specific DNA-methyltransferase [Metabacillus fastidiosus]MED4403321.1 site-specific DNA-methyltransferase [Metabacillus fastidiosus]MED4460676.1 site-specific DNA-methyltransferase [Metabacillus fastidiosus]